MFDSRRTRKPSSVWSFPWVILLYISYSIMGSVSLRTCALILSPKAQYHRGSFNPDRTFLMQAMFWSWSPMHINQSFVSWAGSLVRAMLRSPTPSAFHTFRRLSVYGGLSQPWVLITFLDKTDTIRPWSWAVQASFLRLLRNGKGWWVGHLRKI